MEKTNTKSWSNAFEKYVHPENGESMFLQNVGYESTRRHNPEDQHRHLHRHENLKSHMRTLVKLEVSYFNILVIFCKYAGQSCDTEG
jgi:hypothetical protein